MRLCLIAFALSIPLTTSSAQTPGDWEHSGPTCLLVPQPTGPWAAVCPPAGWVFDRSGNAILLRRAETPVPISMQAFPHSRPSALEQELRRIRGQNPAATTRLLFTMPLASGDSGTVWSAANYLLACAPDTSGDLLVTL